MTRKRYVSTNISVDPKVRDLAQRSEFAAVLYTWMIPHADDAGCISADPEELLMQVVPGFRWRTAEDVQTAIDDMLSLGLVEQYEGRLRFPGKSFYKYQAYIGAERRTAHHEPTPPETNGAEPRKTAQNGAVPHVAPKPAQNPTSFKSSSSSSFSFKSPVLDEEREKGTKKRETAAAVTAPHGAAPRGSPRVAALIDAFRAMNVEPMLGPRDFSAIKHTNAPPGLIVEVFLAVSQGLYGDDFMRKRLSVHEAIDWVGGYVERSLEAAAKVGELDIEREHLYSLGWTQPDARKQA